MERLPSAADPETEEACSEEHVGWRAVGRLVLESAGIGPCNCLGHDHSVARIHLSCSVAYRHRSYRCDLTVKIHGVDVLAVGRVSEDQEVQSLGTAHA